MRSVPVIDTSRYAAELRESGVGPRQAEGMARALNDELAERVLTKADLDERLLPIQHELTELGTRLNAMDVKFETKFDALDGKGALDEKGETGFDALNEKLETRFDALDAKITVLIKVTLFGFMLLIALGVYNALPRATQTAAAPLVEKSPAAIDDAETKR